MRDFKTFTIKNVCKSFGPKQALNNFNLTLEKGQFITFLGPSGCGKSTALNCIAGLIPITSGAMFIDDECIDDGVHSVPPEKREFGMVFQNYALFPHLTVFNNIAFGLELKKLDKQVIRERVKSVLKMVHLEGYEEKFPNQMSGGEQQRVAIARCIVMEPRLLMLDEPLSNLDAKLRIDMRYEIKSIHNRLQISSIYVTHDQQEALALSDRIVVMKSGHIQQVGTPEEVYSQPANLFVADFMGFRNIWPAEIETITEGGAELEVRLNVQGVKLASRLGPEAAQAKRAGLMAAFQKRQPVYTAIRPEDIALGENGPNQQECQVDVVEYLGQTSQVAASFTNGVRIDLRPEARVDQGETIRLTIAPEKIQVFTKEG
ncbi:putative spermidine/putrescine transport system ATP-binding protein [Hydrogenispora ethanolica]|uniref:Putative spermidine/putrescine transport system ATP-binding protein n=1 Tax=Hydrogenispora ethanolica TaxID=1082276 RepID=A0A4R1RIW8_HYDET|nr:ABC transporter ATP-binding protein [Hydrogenispora ethanolica]TCL65939.1 putative spermidine/putrescine transport system ATP-binding protein [Hydrogenispora ethanolica]